MFIIENALDNYRKATERWEDAREKWVNSGDYRYERDYEEKHPRPLNWVKVIGKSVAIGVCIGLMGVLIIGFAKEVKVSNDNKPKEETAQTDGKNCQAFNKGDKVRVQYGDYIGNVGTIIGGCESTEDYQVKIDEGSMANIGNDGNEAAIAVGGRTIAVDDKKNLVKVEDAPKEKQ